MQFNAIIRKKQWPCRNGRLTRFCRWISIEFPLNFYFTSDKDGLNAPNRHHRLHSSSQAVFNTSKFVIRYQKPLSRSKSSFDLTCDFIARLKGTNDLVKILRANNYVRFIG